MHKITYGKKAVKQLKILERNTKLLKKLSEILLDISTDPYSLNYNFERLKYNLSGYCSKRLDQKNRVVYKVEDEIVTVLIVLILGHYDD